MPRCCVSIDDGQGNVVVYVEVTMDDPNQGKVVVTDMAQQAYDSAVGGSPPSNRVKFHTFNVPPHLTTTLIQQHSGPLP